MTAVELDLTESGFVADPYPALASLRSRRELVRHEATGMWLAATHAAVSAVLRERSLGRWWADREPAPRFAAFNALHRHQMMENEPPTHTRLRRLVASAFARGHVERLRARVVELASELLDRCPPEGFDLVADYAEPLPVAVIAELLGVPVVDRPLLRSWSQAIVAMYEYDRSEAVESVAVRASEEFAAYVRDLVDQRRRAPGPDLVSDLVAARDQGGRLSDEELVASVVLLLNAGHEASVNAFGNGVVALLRHPAQLARVTAGEVPVETVLEELLRYDAPLQLFERTAGVDVQVAGVCVAAGERVAALLGAANRDGAVFAAADTLDVARDPNPHVGFGMGVHFCLGAPLARMELAVALRLLLERWPGLRLAGEPARRPTFVLRGYARVPVTAGRPR
ncbi:MAG: cytochrome P450 [Nocardioidaceae bacterium]